MVIKAIFAECINLLKWPIYSRTAVQSLLKVINDDSAKLVA